jgi:hypothetical protein
MSGRTCAVSNEPVGGHWVGWVYRKRNGVVCSGCRICCAARWPIVPIYTWDARGTVPLSLCIKGQAFGSCDDFVEANNAERRPESPAHEATSPSRI